MMTGMSRRKLVWGILIILILIAGSITGVRYFRARDVEIVPVKRGDIVEAVYGLGTVKTPHQYEVRLSVPTQVEEVYVREGDRVKKGSPLIRFDPSPFFRTPMDGVVTLLDAHEAETVVPQKTIVRVENLADRYIEVAFEQQGILRVQTGQKAIAIFESIRGEKFEGRVTAVFSRNQEFLANIEVKGLKENVLPGMTADVAIEVSHHTNALLIPLTALFDGQVLKAGSKGRQKVPVKVGAIDGAWAEVLEGNITEGDSVVVRRREKK
jgi:membrane fusion protein, macrolide-specific efflux system